MDKWDRKTNFNCDSCMYYVPKPKHCFDEKTGRCRRNAPTMKGFPVVYGNADWCGEHKIGSNPVRDAKEEPKPYEHPMGQADNKSLTKEDVRKVLDEPLTSPAWDQPLVSEEAKIIEQVQKKIETSFAADCLVCHTKGYKIENETNCDVEVSGDTIKITNPKEKAATAYYFCVKCDSAWGKVTNEPGEYKTCPKCEEKAKAMLEEKPDDNRKKETITAVYPVDLEEKTRIKAEIVRHLDFMCGDLVIDGKKDDILKYMPSEKQKIQELLEKL